MPENPPLSLDLDKPCNHFELRLADGVGRQTAQAQQAEAQGSERQQAPAGPEVDKAAAGLAGEGKAMPYHISQGQGKAPVGQPGKQALPDSLQPFAGAAPSDPSMSLNIADAASQSQTAQPDPFAGNKISTADKIEAARARLKAKRGTLNSGIDPELLVNGMTIAGAYIEIGVRKYSDYANAMVEDFGEKIRPYLRSFYEAARNYPGLATTGMTTAAELDLMEKQGTAAHTKAGDQNLWMPVNMTSAELADSAAKAVEKISIGNKGKVPTLSAAETSYSASPRLNLLPLNREKAMDNLEDLLTFNPALPSKSWTQLLQENPQQKGGLSQLASAERQALRSQSTEARLSPLKQDTSMLKG